MQATIWLGLVVVDSPAQQEEQQLAHLHVTVSQGLGGPEARLASAAHAYASLLTISLC